MAESGVAKSVKRQHESSEEKRRRNIKCMAWHIKGQHESGVKTS